MTSDSPCFSVAPTNGRTAGLSLIECLAAVAILGAAIVAGLSMFGMHETLADTGEASTQGILLLEREVDRVIGSAYSEVESRAYAPLDDAPSYEIRVVVSKYRADVKLAAVSIRWTQATTEVVREHTASVVKCEE